MKVNKVILLNKSSLTGDEEQYILEPIKSSEISGYGSFTQKCHQWVKEKTIKNIIIITKKFINRM